VVVVASVALITVKNGRKNATIASNVHKSIGPPVGGEPQSVSA
jgi:hypothetical protein